MYIPVLLSKAYTEKIGGKPSTNDIIWKGAFQSEKKYAAKRAIDSWVLLGSKPGIEPGVVIYAAHGTKTRLYRCVKSEKDPSGFQPFEDGYATEEV